MLLKFYHCIFIAFLVFSYGCSSVQVHSDFDPDAEFSTIRTYSWKKVQVPGDSLADNPLLYKRIALSIDKYLQGRGYSLTDQASADVLVAIHAGLKEKMRVTDWGGPRGYYRDPLYDSWWGGGAYGGRVDVSYYTEGTLVIDIVDRKQEELIWRGLGTGIVSPQSSQEKTGETIEEYVQKILNQFPPGYKQEQ